MATQLASQLLGTIEEQVESHVNDAVKIFQNLPGEVLLRPAANGGWSIAQCLWHLNSYGDYYLPKIKSGLAKKYPAKCGAWILSLMKKMESVAGIDTETEFKK